MTARLPSVLLFTLGDRAPEGLGDTPCYLHRRAHAARTKHLKAIPEAPCDEAAVAAMFEALDAALDDWSLTDELYTDHERATREGTDSDPIGFHPGLDRARARAALEQGGFRVVLRRPGKSPQKFASADEALTALEHHLEHSSLALARKVTPETFSHHHLERARHALQAGATAKFSRSFLAAVAARARLSKEASAVLDLLLAYEARPEGLEPLRALARPATVKATVKTAKTAKTAKATVKKVKTAKRLPKASMAMR